MVGVNIFQTLSLVICCLLCWFCCGSYRRLISSFVTKECKEKKTATECTASTFLLCSGCSYQIHEGKVVSVNCTVRWGRQIRDTLHSAALCAEKRCNCSWSFLGKIEFCRSFSVLFLYENNLRICHMVSKQTSIAIH